MLVTNQSSTPIKAPDGRSYVLGLHQGHEAAVTVLRDGVPVFAIAEERLSRRKHDMRFPKRALELALETLRIDISDLSAIATTPTEGMPDARPPLLKSILKDSGASDKVPIHVVGHHLAHAASAFYPSGFEDALVFTFDGRGGPMTGGREAYALFKGKGTKLETIWRRADSTCSFGGIYGAVSGSALGSQNINFVDDAGKGMGLAPYGMPGVVEVKGWTESAIDSHLEEFGDIDCESGIVTFKQRPLSYGFKLLEFRDAVFEDVSRVVSKIVDLPRSDDRFGKLAMYFTQRWFERMLLKLIDYWLGKTGLKKVCLAGGCALNSVANTKLAQLESVEGLFIQPAAGDSGTALGAAMLVAHRLLEAPRAPAQVSDALGRGWSPAEIEEQFKA